MLSTKTDANHSPAQEVVSGRPDWGAQGPLPAELIDIILSDLEGDTETLRICTTVARGWLPCARHYLSQDSTFRLLHHSGAAQDLSALISSPYCSILPYVTDLTIDIAWSRVGLLQTSIKLLPASTPVRILWLHNAAWDAVRLPDREYLLSRFSSITKLQLHQIECPISEMQTTIWRYAAHGLRAGNSEAIRSLLGDAVPAKIKAPREQPGGISSTITVVRLNPTRFVHFGQLPPAISVEMTCLHFNLRLRRLHFDDTDFISFVPWMAGLDAMPPLEYLHISITPRVDLRTRPLERLLSLLSPSIKHLTFGILPMPQHLERGTAELSVADDIEVHQ
ncbi:hypothetical protein DFH07DRAFT_956157 [Mycena maculata]|uniref:Uncharacterized protein n=1 Tax=Mycena maculata TaxID=230809 RepID=A0AAD7JGS2_9AGAR|nr:hypothetical protein DFH07DRAFT_956157 [Mycena maculata]